MSATARATRPGEQLIGLVAALALVAIAASIGGWLTSAALGTWYEGLAKPDWTPSGATIGAIWTTLYLLMAVAAWLVWRRVGYRRARLALLLFGLQLALNVGWSALFFGARAPGLALAEIVFLWIAVFATAISFWPHSRVAAALMIPYVAWVAFAAFLNANVVRLNM